MGIMKIIKFILKLLGYFFIWNFLTHEIMLRSIDLYKDVSPKLFLIRLIIPIVLTGLSALGLADEIFFSEKRFEHDLPDEEFNEEFEMSLINKDRRRRRGYLTSSFYFLTHFLFFLKYLLLSFVPYKSSGRGDKFMNKNIESIIKE